MSDESDFEVTPATPEETIETLRDHVEASEGLVMASCIETWLERLLIAVSRPLSNTTAAKIFAGYGPLSQFSAKIDIAYIFKFIDETTYNDLRAIKEIRNRFAHTTEHLFFSSEKVARECQRLKGWGPGVNNRALFFERCNACYESISARMDKQLFDGAMSDEPASSLGKDGQ